MIEILEVGTKKKVRCNNCGALLSYEKSDVKNETVKTMMPLGDGHKLIKDYIICPQCKENVYLTKSR